MNDYRKEVNQLVNEAPWTIGKIFLKVFLPLMLIGFISLWVGGVFNVAIQPMKAIQKTFDADKMIHDYEWFHDVFTQQKARVNQVIQFKGFLKSETDKEERQRLRMEMAAQQMSCRDLVAKYNANSEKMNVGIFKGWSLPDKLESNKCE